MFGKLIYYNCYYLCMYSHTHVYGLLTITIIYSTHSCTLLLLPFHAVGRRKKEKFPNFSSRINITILARDNRKIRRCTTLYPSSVFFTHISYSRLIIPHVTFPAKGKVKQRSKRSSSRINDARRRCNRVPLTQFHWQDLVDRSLQYP